MKIFSIAFFFTLTRLATAQTLYENIYYDLASGHLRDIIQLESGGYAACGGDYNIAMIMKIDADGNLVWSKVPDIAGFCNFYDIHETNDHQLLVTGDYDGEGGQYNLIMMFSEDGDSLWSEIFSYPGENISRLAQTIDDDFIFLVNAYRTHDSSYLNIKKLNLEGELLIDSTFFYPENNFVGAFPVNDGVCVSITGEDSIGDALVYFETFSRINNEGEMLFKDTVDNFIFNCGIGSADGNYIVMGRSNQVSIFWDVSVRKFDPEGNAIWEKVFSLPGTLWPTAMCEMQDHSIVLSLKARDENWDLTTNILFHISSEGDSLSLSKINISDHYYFEDIMMNSDEEYVLAGLYIDHDLMIFSAPAVVLFDETAISPYVSIPEQDDLAAFNVYPNPSTGSISFESLQPDDQLNIYNANGQLVYHAYIKDTNNQFNFSFLESGMYFYSSPNNNILQQGKFIIEH